MQITVIVLAVETTILVIFALAFAWMLSKRSRTNENVEEQLQRFQEVIQTQVQGVKEQVASNLDSVQHNVRSQIDLMASVRQGLGELSETAKTMKGLGEDIVALEDLLRPPKFRGEIGEFLLENLLEQVVPKGHFALQYGFRDGKVVDAAIFLQEKIVPVDSKFPLESFVRILDSENESESKRRRREFERTVRGHIDAVAQYIRPAEGTLEFGLMYVPAENVYYEMVTRRQDEGVDLCAYALSKKVIPVSPNSFYLYLQSVAIGLRGLQLESKVEEVWSVLSTLSMQVNGLLEQDFRILGRHLKNAGDKYDDTRKGLERLGDELRFARQMPIGDSPQNAIPSNQETGLPSRSTIDNHSESEGEN
jgi:DNA recombination protein RmuC